MGRPLSAGISVKAADDPRAYQREWYRKHRATSPERRARALEAAKAAYWRSIQDPSSWPKRAWMTARRRAAEAGLAFDIEPADLVIPDTCPALGVSFVMRGRNHPFNPSVDRKDPRLGYVKGNVAVITRRANTMKSNSVSPDEMRRIATYMERSGLDG